MVEDILLSKHMANMLDIQRIHEGTLIVWLYLFELSDNLIICMSNIYSYSSTLNISGGWCIWFIDSLNSMWYIRVDFLWCFILHSDVNTSTVTQLSKYIVLLWLVLRYFLNLLPLDIHRHYKLITMLLYKIVFIWMESLATYTDCIILKDGLSSLFTRKTSNVSSSKRLTNIHHTLRTQFSIQAWRTYSLVVTLRESIATSIVTTHHTSIEQLSTILGNFWFYKIS